MEEIRYKMVYRNGGNFHLPDAEGAFGEAQGTLTIEYKDSLPIRIFNAKLFRALPRYLSDSYVTIPVATHGKDKGSRVYILRNC